MGRAMSGAVGRPRARWTCRCRELWIEDGVGALMFLDPGWEMDWLAGGSQQQAEQRWTWGDRSLQRVGTRGQ